MLKTHFQNCEKQLLSQFQIPSITGHTLHKGNPREAFVKEFLVHHLPSLVDVGTGEIIDKRSMPGESRNQHDIVIFQKTFPKLDFGGGTLGFLIESVCATIEVKSLLNKEQVRQAVNAAYRVKHLNRTSGSGITIGNCTDSLFSGVVAYSGPEHMITVAQWVRECEAELGISDEISARESIKGRNVLAPSIDAVLLLGKGVVYAKSRRILNISLRDEDLWCSVESECDNLILFFLMMLTTVGTIRMEGWEAAEYVGGVRYSNIKGV